MSADIVISAHLDDAVLSLGQFLAQKPSLVVTVFAGAPAGGVSEYDDACGFTTSEEAVAERRAEDEKALASLGCQWIRLPFLDRQYQTPRDPAQITDALRQFFVRDAHLWAPLGLGHPDHRLVARCARAACPEFGEVLCYEDFPYRTMWPEQVYPALEQVRADGFDVVPYEVKQGPWEAKAAAVACYASQFPDGATDPCLAVPERAWRATR